MVETELRRRVQELKAKGLTTSEIARVVHRTTQRIYQLLQEPKEKE